MRPPRRFLGGFGVAAVALLAAAATGMFPGRWWPQGFGAATPPEVAAQAAAAERRMADAAQLLAEAKAAAGLVPDPAVAPGASGLVGDELTPLVTTLGSLEAKSLAARPAWARALVVQFHRAGIGRGSVVAASFSGSFPGLDLAVTVAGQALGARVIAVSSVTASTWGANQPGFTWPEMEARLVAARMIQRASIAVSAGGEGDEARDLEPEGRALAVGIRDRAASQLGVPALRAVDASEAARLRLAAYERAADGQPIRVYVNVGGHTASLGDSPAILRQRSGWLAPRPFDLSPGRGLVARFAERGVPVLHLLNVRDLALRWGVL